MDRLISSSEANQRFSEMLRAVANGDSFTVTSHGRPVARMVPVESDETRRRAFHQLMEEWEKLPLRYSGPWTREDLYE